MYNSFKHPNKQKSRFDFRYCENKKYKWSARIILWWKNGWIDVNGNSFPSQSILAAWFKQNCEKPVKIREMTKLTAYGGLVTYLYFSSKNDFIQFKLTWS
jgi:hypothetical protein